MPNGPLDPNQNNTAKDDTEQEDFVGGVAKQFGKGFQAGKDDAQHDDDDDK
jgi:hypothetical protein